jgi:hypothetical protein
MGALEIFKLPFKVCATPDGHCKKKKSCRVERERTREKRGDIFEIDPLFSFAIFLLPDRSQCIEEVLSTRWLH